MSSNLWNTTTPDRHVTSSENRLIPAETTAGILAFSELHTLRRLRGAMHHAVRENSRFMFAEVEDTVRVKCERGALGIAAVSSVETRRILTDIDYARGFADSVVRDKRVAAAHLGPLAAHALVLADIVMARMLHGDTKRGREATLEFVVKDVAEAERRWHPHRAEILRAHPEINWKDPAFHLVQNDGKPYYLVPVTL